MKYVLYSIVNKVTGTKYIGSTQHTKRRRAGHVFALKQKRHHNRFLQNDWNTQPKTDFAFKIVAKFKSREIAYEVEKTVIACLIKKGLCYNILNGSRGGDALTYHPDYIKLCKAKKKAAKKYVASLSDKERKARFSRLGETNPNFKGWSSKSWCECGNEKSLTATTCVKCYDKNGKGNPFFGKKHSKETIAKLRKANKGKLPANTNRVEIDGKIYKSQSDAARKLNVAAGTITFRLKSKNPKFKSYRVLNA